MAPVTSKRDAERLVREIRASRRADDPADENSIDLANALKLISDELYSTPTHFILELVQNADDNKYDPGVTAKLVFLYRDDGFLWVACNENGFLAENVRSICRFHRSTKGVEEAVKGSIGEKGIGFKSVFKVADKVWISSGRFHFRFDRDARLGMIAPVWDEETPQQTLINETTVICMRIPDPDSRQLVQQHLHELEPELPLFLRNIRHLQVIFQESNGKVSENYTLMRKVPHEKGFDVKLVKKNHNKGTEETLLRLIHVEYVAHSMPYEKRREGIESTKLQMEFPVTSTGTPELKNRPLYNFLPVRAYGLPFLLNADFLLSANREDVERGKKWNEALLSATIELFLESVRRFNREGILKYTWPRYTQRLAGMEGTVFHDLLPDIIKRLEQEIVLESQKGVLKSPKSLVYVPLQFTDGASPPLPLLDSQRNLQSFLATQYSKADVSCLGVRTLTVTSFIDGKLLGLDGLRSYTQDHRTHFQNRSNAWHSRVALAITGNASPSTLRNINLIPLRGGDWVAAAKHTFYFPELEGGLKIPSGVRMSVVDIVAAQDAHRREMFKWLGAQNLNAASVSLTLLKEHTNHSDTWDKKTVISHAWYLFHAYKTLPKATQDELPLDELRLAVKDSPSLLKGQSLYVDDGGEFSVAKFIPQDSGIVRYIDPAYFAGIPSNLSAEFKAWLKGKPDMRRTPGVQTIPTLRKLYTESLSEEFQFILKNTSSRKFLRLLMVHWGSYEDDSQRGDIAKTIKSTSVRCTNGSQNPLEKTFLPLPPLTNFPFAKDVLPFIDISDKKNPQWKNLGVFGVGTDVNLRFCLRVLSGLAQNNNTPSLRPTMEEVAQIYEAIQNKCSNLTSDQVMDAFLKEPVIFVPTGASFKWVNLTGCVWHAPTQLRKIIALSRYYPKLESLFVDYLKVANASTPDMVGELMCYEGQTSHVSDIKNLLEALNALLSLGANHESIDRLYAARVFPVQMSTGKLQLKSCRANDWCIADKDSLRTCFEDKLYLLDFTVKDAKEDGKLGPLLKRLKILDRCLSRKINEKTVTKGTFAESQELTDMLRWKARYISRLVSKDKRQAVLKELTNAQIFCAENLILRRSVSMGTSTIISDDDGMVTMSKGESGNVCIYLRAQDVASGEIPTWQMQNQLCSFFDIPDAHANFIQCILGMNSERQLEDMLERSGIDKDDSDDEQLEEELRNYAEPQEPGKKHSEPLKIPRSSFQSTAWSWENGSMSPFRSRRNFQPQGFQSFSSGNSGPSFTMDTATIVAAADDFNSYHIAGFGAGLGTPSSNESRAFSSFTAISNTSRSGHGQSTSSHQIGESSANNDPHALLNMSTMVQALPSITSIPGRGPRTPRPARIDAVPQEPDIPDYNVAVGAAGEYFVYRLFKGLFDIDDEAWTSNIRTRFGFPEMTTFEGDYADFTIVDSNAVDKFTDWLVTGGHAEAAEWKGKEITYHIEVKTTTGGCNDAFTMSNNQFDLIQQWHESPTDVCILLHVFRFGSTPGMSRFVDPFALHMTGQLKFQAQGFWVQPA